MSTCMGTDALCGGRRHEVKLAWYMLKGFVVGLLTAPIYALLYVYDMTYTFPHDALKGGAK